MACTFTVKDPKTGKEIASPLFEGLEKHYQNSAEAETAYRNIFLPNFLTKFGNWTLDSDAYILKDNDGNSKLDKHGEPLLSDVIRYQAHWVLQQKSHNIGQFKDTISPEYNRLQKIIDTLGIRLKNLRRVKSTIHTKNKLKLQIETLLQSINDLNSVKGYIIYTENALREVKEVKNIINSLKGTITSVELQKIYSTIEAYRDIERIVKEASSTSVDANGSLYTLPDEVMSSLHTIQNDIDNIKNIYHEKAIEHVSENLLGEEFESNMYEFFRNAYVRTKEGSKQKGENIETYRKRVQEHVKREMSSNHMNIEEDRKSHVMRMLAIGTDIGSMERWMLNSSQTTSPILRAINIAILNAEDKLRIKFNGDVSLLDTIYEEYKAHQTGMGKNAGSPMKFYELIAEKQLDEKGNLIEEKGSGYYVHRWHSSWTEDYKKIKKKMSEIKKNSILNEIGEIDSTNPKNKKNIAMYKALQSLYTSNTSYDSESHIGAHKDRISAAYKASRELGIKLKGALRSYNIITKKANLTTTDIANMKKLDDTITLLRNERSDKLSEASSLEQTLKKELFTHQDLLHVPHIANINKHRENVKKLMGLSLQNPKDYKSSQYIKLEELKKNDPNHIVYRYYQAVMGSIQRADSLYGEEFQLGFRMIGRQKALWERWTSDVKGVFSGKIWEYWGKPLLKQTLQYTKGKDVDSMIQRGEQESSSMTLKNYQRKVKTDYRGNQGQHIPIYFRGQLDPSEQSMMVHDNILATLYVGYNYHYKNELLPTIEQLMHLLENRETIQTAGFSQFVRDNAGSLTKVTSKKTEGGKNLTYEAAKDLIEQRMFGEAIKEAGLVVTDKNISLRKLWQLWVEYIGVTLLSGNWMTTASNLILGNTLTLSESFSSEFFGTNDLIQANKDYDMDLMNILNDIGRPYGRSKTNLLNIMFDPLNEFSLHDHVYAFNNKHKALLNKSSLHGLNGMAEHSMHAIPMYAILRSIKVLDKDKNYIHSQGKNKKNLERKDSLSLAKAYKREKTNTPGRHFNLVLPKEVKFIEYRIGETYHILPLNGKVSNDINVKNIQEAENSETLVKITHLIQAMNESLHGAYSHRNSAPIQRYWYGQALYNMRKFFPVSLVRRWQGLPKALWHLGETTKNRSKGNSQFFIDSKEGTNTSTRMYDPRTGVVKESMYVTTMKFGAYSAYEFYLTLKQLMGRTEKDLQKSKLTLLSATTEDWTNLSQHEKSNIVRTVAELGIATMAYFAASAFKGRGKKDKEYYLYAFFLARLNTELIAYINPKEAGRLLLSPATTVSMIERLWGAFSQISDDMMDGEFERYQAGSRKGDTKASKAWGDIIPWYKAANRHKYVEDILSFHYRD